MDAVLSCMVTDSLGPGSLADQLTGAVGEYLGLAGGIALRERARAFAVALDQLELPEGAAVILDPLAPHVYHRVLLERGLAPVYVDVLDTSLCIDPDGVGRAIELIVESGGHVGAIIARTALGFVPEMESIAAFGVPIIEDISEGIGANTGEERLGRFGRFVLVAMEPESVITAGGGSLLLTASKSDRASLRRAAQNLSSDSLLQDMNAALGLTQIREIEKFIARRAEIAAVYTRAIMRGRHHAPVQPGEAQNVFLTFPVLIEGSVGDVVSYSRKKGVETTHVFSGSVLDRYGRSEHDEGAEEQEQADGAAGRVAEADFPVSRSLLLRCLHFPLYPS
ncbi:MAG: DegT/DnrJ/EryC1/StrS family aminotransferase, partial [Spirochaetota bacterium]